jgi:hypothetical protein
MGWSTRLATSIARASYPVSTQYAAVGAGAVDLSYAKMKEEYYQVVYL